MARTTRILLIALVALATATAQETLDLSKASIVVSGGHAGKLAQVPAEVLQQEIAKRTTITLPIVKTGKGNATITLRVVRGPAASSERYSVHTSTKSALVEIEAQSARGLLFGVGRVLMTANMAKGVLSIPAHLSIDSKPVYAIRGHQLGYRAAANSWDGWTAEQFDQYIRELALFGTNCIENIPFQDDRKSPHMVMTRDEANIKMSDICAKYDLDYWVWTPADFDLNDQTKRAEQLKQYDVLSKTCKRLDHIFFPGGDPGDNDPSLVMPYLKEVAAVVRKLHPQAGVWISLQGYTPKQVDWFYDYLNREKPTWLTGLVTGPSSPPIDESRQRLPIQYKHRHYPDITHSVRAEYPVVWWDPAFAQTLGRECPNPRPLFEASLHNLYAPYTDGFLTYSDGVHDDVNKAIWSMCAWDPTRPVHDMLRDYAWLFFTPSIADTAADGISALEKNWEGAAIDNGGIEATRILWDSLASTHPELKDNWRWQLCLVRADYDAFIRQRYALEQKIEADANAALLAPKKDSKALIANARALLEGSNAMKDLPLHKSIESLCEDLFKSVKLQTSVDKYGASGAERGAILDFIDTPLNNNWWLEDEFKKVEAMPVEADRIARLYEIATWENPGPGSFYDAIGNLGKSKHVIVGENIFTDPERRRSPNPDHVWRDNGTCRDRKSWLTYMDWPLGVRYMVDPKANYVVRISGQGEALTKIDGERVQPTKYGKQPGEIKEFPVPATALADGVIIVNWDVPDEAALNWRQRSRINEIWLIRQPLPK